MLLHFHFTNDIIHFAAASHCKSIRNCIQIEMDIGNRTILSIFLFYTTGISLFSLFSLKALSFSSFHTLFFQHVQKIENSSRKKCIWMYHIHTGTHTYRCRRSLWATLFLALSGISSYSSCTLPCTLCPIRVWCAALFQLARVMPQWLSSHMHCIQLCITSGLVSLPVDFSFYACGWLPQ